VEGGEGRDMGGEKQCSCRYFTALEGRIGGRCPTVNISWGSIDEGKREMRCA